jgi:hypothetical protein
VGFSTSDSCTTTGYTVGGSISGLGAGLSVALRNATTGENPTTIVVTELPAGRNLGMPRLAGSGRDAVLVWTEADGAGGTRL